MPETQQKLAEAVCDNCENVIVVVMSGSPIDVGEKVRNHAKAIIQAWYPGAQGGLAVAELIAGVYSPSGRLPLTFYRGDDVLPDFSDYSMKGRTYRFIENEPLYPFGYGLSYTDFRYDNISCVESDEELKITCDVTNCGKCPGREIVQVYSKFKHSTISTPNYQLCGVKSIKLDKNETKRVTMTVDKYWIKAVDENGNRIEPDGEITLFVGGHQPDELSDRLCGNSCTTLKIK